MSRYLVKLKPLEPYFFGNERNYGYEKDEKKDKNYLVKSNPLPQQTAILGLLRKELLVRSNLLKPNWNYSGKDVNEINQLIGKKSFNIEQKEEQDFGAIQRISPIMICSESQNEYSFYIPVPKDHNLEKSTEKYTPFTLTTKEIKVSFSDSKISTPKPKEYNAKKGLANQWMEFTVKDNMEYKQNPYSLIEFSDIFQEDEKIGIRKSPDGRTVEEGFYKRVDYFLKEDYIFAFIVELDENNQVYNDKISESSENEWTNIAYLGGEKSSFKFTIEKIHYSWNSIIHHVQAENGKNKKIILWSDAYLDNPYEYCEFGISETVDFRNMRTEKSDQKHSDDNHRFKKIKNKYTFLKRGSILYPKDYDRIVEKIKSYTNLRKIGYNSIVNEE